MEIRLPTKLGRGQPSKKVMELYLQSLKDFADDLKAIQETLDFHMGGRDWCYTMEPEHMGGLQKGQFNWAKEQIDKAREKGFLEPGFILEEDGHVVSNEYDIDQNPEDYVDEELDKFEAAEQTFLDCHVEYDWLSFWKDKKYYIQLLVEKVGLASMFRKVCNKYHIPIANMRGWGSYEQKAVIAEGFKEAEAEGRKPVLLVCTDHDPPGLNISDVIKKSFEKLRGFTGWDPYNLIVDRIGLNYNFIQDNRLSWIEGLETGSGKNLASPKHPFYKNNTYDVQGYIKQFGARKCEANAIVVVPELGREMLENAILNYLGKDAYNNYKIELKKRKERVKELIKESMQNDE